MMMMKLMMMMMMQVTVRMEEPRYNRIVVSVRKFDPPQPENVLVRIGQFPLFKKCLKVCLFF